MEEQASQIHEGRLPIKGKAIEKDPLESRGKPFTPYSEELRKIELREGNE